MEEAAGMENSSAGMDYIGNDNFVFYNTPWNTRSRVLRELRASDHWL